MKKGKFVAVLLVVALMLSMLFACARPAEEKITDIKLMSASVGTGSFVNACAISAMVAAYSEWLRVTPTPTPGWIDALRLIRDERGDIATSGSINIAAMMKGMQWFEGKEQYTGLRWLWPNMFPRTMVMSKIGSPFRTLDDLKDAVVAVPLLGTTAETDARAILEALPFEPKKIIYLARVDHASAMKDGTADVFINARSLGAPQIVEFCTVNDVHFIPMDREIFEKSYMPELGYALLTIPAGTYRLQDYDVPCQAKGGYIVATERLSDEIVYEVTRCFWHEIGQTKKLNPAVIGDCIDTVESTLHLPGPSPIHPGAEKYFKEVGMLK